MFWFFSWEGFRRRRGNTLVASVPPPEFRNGDFSSLLTQSNPIYLRDPLKTGNCNASDRTACFPNNIIPQARINPAIPNALEAVVPLPNRPGTIQNLVSNRSQANDRDLYNVRWDYNLNTSNSFNFRYSRQNADLSNPQANPAFTTDQPVRRDQLRRQLDPCLQPDDDTRSRLRLQPSGWWWRHHGQADHARRLSLTRPVSKCTRPRSSATRWSTSALARIQLAVVALRSLATGSGKAEGI